MDIYYLNFWLDCSHLINKANALLSQIMANKWIARNLLIHYVSLSSHNFKFILFAFCYLPRHQGHKSVVNIHDTSLKDIIMIVIPIFLVHPEVWLGRIVVNLDFGRLNPSAFQVML